MLERENIDNFIADDLALRNRNWGQIEDELDERYTKDETDGLLAGKADLNDSLTINNVTNLSSDQVIESPVDNPYTSFLVRYEPLSQGIYVLSVDYEYLETSGEPLPENMLVASAYEGRTLGRIHVNESVGRSSIMFEITSELVDQGIRIYSSIGHSASLPYHTTWTRVMAINLTDTFGAGNEPTVPEMNELIDLLGDWVVGEITVSQKTLAIWTLNLIRQNRNAIIALGGTIV